MIPGAALLAKVCDRVRTEHHPLTQSPAVEIEARYGDPATLAILGQYGEVIDSTQDFPPAALGTVVVVFGPYDKPVEVYGTSLTVPFMMHEYTGSCACPVRLGIGDTLSVPVMMEID